MCATHITCTKCYGQNAMLHSDTHWLAHVWYVLDWYMYVSTGIIIPIIVGSTLFSNLVKLRSVQWDAIWHASSHVPCSGYI